MAVGDLVTAPFVYEFRTLAFGSGTDYVVEKVTGLLDEPPTKDKDTDRAHDHGSNPGVLLYGKRIISFDVKIKGTISDIDAKIANAQKVFGAPRIRYSTVMEPFVFQRRGGVKKVIYVRCTKRSFPSNFQTARGFAVGSVELQAPDPLIYTLAASQAVINVGVGVTTANTNATMNGDHADGADPIITIVGPATNPIVTNATDDNRALRFQVVLAVGDAIRVNMKTRRVERRIGVGGTFAKDFSIVRNDNQWWALVPGVNAITYTRTGSAAAGSCTLDWQDTWR